MLMTGRLLFHYHTGTMTRRSKTLESEVPAGSVEINVDDAASMDIKEGDAVKVSSRRGEIETTAHVTGDIQKGMIFMSFHFAESPVNRADEFRPRPYLENARAKILCGSGTQS